MATAESEDAREERDELALLRSQVADPNSELYIKDPFLSRWKLSLSSELYIKDPFLSRWKLSLDITTFNDTSNGRRESTSESIGSFNNTKDFWSVFGKMKPPSKLQNNSEYHLCNDLYLTDISQEEFLKGGNWIIHLDRRQRHTHLDTVWLKAMLYVIGETSKECASIITHIDVRISSSKRDKLHVLTSDAQNEEANMKIGRRLKQRLNLHPKYLLPYRAFINDERKTDKTKSRYKYIVY